ncbi:MAG: transferase hexapeptide repeat family protein [Crocinitomicaceae bacterium]|nr:transferase hexapeptide repeat family protein [Crocinitomicaceae bacterium]
MATYSFEGFIPVVDPTSYIHETASIIGDVIIGKDCYVGPGAVIRGDWGRITLEDGCNVQENCVVHMFPGKHITFESGAHVGHGAVVHGATLKANCLIGMNAVVMDGAIVGKNSIVGALSFVKAEEIIPDNHLFAGNPGRIIKEISADMIAWKTEGTALYQSLPALYHASLLPVTPLSEVEDNRPSHEMVYKTWKTRQ